MMSVQFLENIQMSQPAEDALGTSSVFSLDTSLMMDLGITEYQRTLKLLDPKDLNKVEKCLSVCVSEVNSKLQYCI